MKNLVAKLQEDAGLTNDQARMAVGIFRDYLIECEKDPDVVETIKIKTSHVVDQVENTFNNIAGEATEKADELLHKAKRKAKTIVDKLSDYLKD